MSNLETIMDYFMLGLITTLLVGPLVVVACHNFIVWKMK